MEGESFRIRCHSWRNMTVKKVTYYRNGTALRYDYDNFDMPIANAQIRDSGSYFCTGWIQRLNQTSEPLNITVKKGELVKQEGCSWQGKGESDPPA